MNKLEKMFTFAAKKYFYPKIRGGLNGHLKKN